MKTNLFFLLLSLYSAFTFSQTVLNANGPGNTYEEFNTFFASGNTAVEAPDQTVHEVDGTHIAFGRHIDEVFDATQNKFVFRFISHLANDNDVSTTSTDRQRVEVKTLDSSPSNMKGTTGETVTYKWRFKIPTGFQPSTNFTHLHQIKPVGGDAADPLFTITVRKATPNRVELRYDQTAASTAFNLTTAALSLFENQWVEVTETIFIHPVTGTYSMRINRISDATTLLNYSNTNISTIRSDNTFIRPKWGIYRSIAISADLRDEEVLFSDFSVTEGVLDTENFETEFSGLKTNIIDNYLEFTFTDNEQKEFKIYNNTGSEVKTFSAKNSQKINVEELATGIYFLKNKEGKMARFIKK